DGRSGGATIVREGLLASSDRLVKLKYANDGEFPNVTMPFPVAGGDAGEKAAAVPVAVIFSVLAPAPPAIVQLDDVVSAASPAPVTLTVSSPPPMAIAVVTPAGVASIEALSFAAPKTTSSVCWPAGLLLL